MYDVSWLELKLTPAASAFPILSQLFHIGHQPTHMTADMQQNQSVSHSVMQQHIVNSVLMPVILWRAGRGGVISKFLCQSLILKPCCQVFDAFVQIIWLPVLGPCFFPPWLFPVGIYRCVSRFWGRPPAVVLQGATADRFIAGFSRWIMEQCRLGTSYVVVRFLRHNFQLAADLARGCIACALFALLCTLTGVLLPPVFAYHGVHCFHLRKK